MLYRLFAPLVDGLDRRLPWRRTLNRLLSDPVPERGGWWYTLGAALFVLVFIQIATGIFLMFFYVPSWDHARESVSYIQNEVYLGWLVRGLHYWNMVALVLLIGAHMARTFFSAAYKAPRELTWVLGVTLLILMVATAFTGGILRWDQGGYFDAVVGTTIAGWTPIIGPGLAALWRGGETISSLTLTRTFTFHVWLLPVGLVVLATVHVALVVIQGQFGSWVNYEPEPAEAEPPDEDELASQAKVRREVLSPESRKVNLPWRTTWFFPHHMFKEAVVTGAIFLVVFLIALTFRVPIEEPIDPSTTTYAPSSMWFWLFLDQLLLLFPGAWLIPFAVIGVPTVMVVVFYLLPWLDRNPALKPQSRPLAVMFMAVVILSILVLALLGASRVFNYDFVGSPG